MCHFLYGEDVLKDYYGGKYTISLTDSKSRWLFNKTSIICSIRYPSLHNTIVLVHYIG